MAFRGGVTVQQDVPMDFRFQSFRAFPKLRFQVWVRRLHLYAGLAMLPWLLFFGFSGLLFNHPGLGEQVEGTRVGPDQLHDAGIAAWPPAVVAQRVIGNLNQSAELAGLVPLELDRERASEWVGFTVLSAPFERGRHTLLLDMQQTRGVIITRRLPGEPRGEAFPRTHVELPDHTTKAVEGKLEGLLESQGMPALSALRAHPKLAPQLRLVARDAAGISWNLSYDARTGEVSGRRSDSFPSLGMSQLLGMLHTTHHFPLRVGALWFWALFEDLLGLSMVLWAVTGMIMWWQVKRTRLWGAASLVAALALAGWVMTGTLHHVTFDDVRPQLGPGE